MGADGVYRRMVNTVAKGVKSGAWQGDNGVITEGASPNSNNDGVGFKGTAVGLSYSSF